MSQGIYDQFINLNNKAYQELLREAKRREQKANKGKKVKAEPEKNMQEATVTEQEVEREFTNTKTFVADSIFSLIPCATCIFFNI
jgi:hypothetical protein